MPKITELRNHSIAAEKVPPELVGDNEVYQLSFQDKVTGDGIFIRFHRDVRDHIIAQLHGSGIVLASDVPAKH